jgi:hypothetical protein
VKSFYLIHNIIIDQEGVNEALNSQINENLTNPNQDPNQHTVRRNNRSKEDARIS